MVDPVNWQHHLPNWADVIAPDLPAVPRAALHAVLLGEQPPVLYAGRRLTRKRLNHFLQIAGMGPYRRLLAVLRLTTALQVLWANPELTLAEVALRSPIPYADANSFSNRCKELLGRRPSELRGLLAWEWVLWTALRIQL